MVKIKIAWKGPGWYVGRYDENENIIVERVAAYEMSRAEVIALTGNKNISSYSEPPPYMERVAEEK